MQISPDELSAMVKELADERSSAVAEVFRLRGELEAMGMRLQDARDERQSESVAKQTWKMRYQEALR